MFGFTNKKNTIGLDISDLNLKAVQLNKFGKKIKIQGLGRIDLPKGIIERGSIKDPQVVAAALTNLLSKPLHGSFTSNQIVVSLPETRTFIKLITVEKGANSLEAILESEIEKYIPLNISEMYYDYQIIGSSNDEYRILIGAAPKHIVDQYINLIKIAKLEVSAIEIEAMSICRSLLPEESPKFEGKLESSYGIIDIGAKRTSLIVYSRGSIVFTLSMPISGEEITERIAGTLEITRDQAEKAKIICGLDKNNARGIIHEILNDMIQDLTGRLSDTFDFYNKNYPDLPPIKKLLICGGGSNIKNLPDILASALNIEVAKCDPFVNINDSEENFGKSLIETHNLKNEKVSNLNYKLSTKQSSGLSYVTAIGLAERNFFLAKK